MSVVIWIPTVVALLAVAVCLLAPAPSREVDDYVVGVSF